MPEERRSLNGGRGAAVELCRSLPELARASSGCVAASAARRRAVARVVGHKASSGLFAVGGAIVIKEVGEGKLEPGTSDAMPSWVHCRC